MRIGYPCITRSIGCQGNRTFRLKSYSAERMQQTIENNLTCLEEVLKFNRDNNLLFFRVSSDLIPFASHPTCDYNWKHAFQSAFGRIGRLIKDSGMRISMHPDQFTLINSIEERVFERSVNELIYHSEVMESMKLDRTHKIQIHLGGVYKDKKKSMRRFVDRYETLPHTVRNRLVIENDDRLYNLKNCLAINSEVGIPVLLDTLHHEVYNSGETLTDTLRLFTRTWHQSDGLPMVDYSHQDPGKRSGKHAESIRIKAFRRFLAQSKPYDFDIMLEIKDKENSALKAVQATKLDSRFKAYRSRA